MMVLEQFAGPVWRRHVRGATPEAAESGKDTVRVAVSQQPVLLAHIGKKAVKTLGEERGIRGELPVRRVGKRGEVRGRGEYRRVARQEMVIDDVGDGPGVKPVRRTEKSLRPARGRMIIGKPINGPMERDALADGFRIVPFSFSLDEITDDVSGEDGGIAK